MESKTYVAPVASNQHTRGPWGIEWTDERAWIGPMRMHDGKISRVVTSTERAGLVPESLAEKDANARLISAAPELLEACEQMLASALPNKEEHPTMFAVWQVAQAAIAKALGTNL